MIAQTENVQNGLYLILREGSEDWSIEIKIPERVGPLELRELCEDNRIVEIFRLDPSLTQREATYLHNWFNNGHTLVRTYRCDIKLREGLLMHPNPEKPCPLQYQYTQWNQARKEHLAQTEQERLRA